MISSATLDIKGNRHIYVATDSASEPVTTDELKIWARIDGNDEDDLIDGIIKTARLAVEKYLNRSLINKTIELTLDEWNSDKIELPLGPVSSITDVVTIDEDDTETTYSSDYYYLASNYVDTLCLKSTSTYPTNTERSYGGFKITYVAGYGATSSSVPQAILDSVKTLATNIYENRNPSMEMPPDIKLILKQFRVYNS